MRSFKNILKVNRLLLKNNYYKQFHSSSSQLNVKYSYYSSRTDHPLSYETIGASLEKACNTYGDREAHVFCESNERITFAQLKKKAEDIASGLLALGTSTKFRHHILHLKKKI